MPATTEQAGKKLVSSGDVLNSRFESRLLRPGFSAFLLLTRAVFASEDSGHAAKATAGTHRSMMWPVRPFLLISCSLTSRLPYGETT